MKIKISLIICFFLFCTAYSGSLYSFAQSYDSRGKFEIIVDPKNKQNISGNIKIAFAWGENFYPPINLARGVINLKEAMNRWTKVQTSLDDHLLLSTPKLLKMPFVFIISDKVFELTPLEKENMKKYFDNGGFVFLDNPNPKQEISQGQASLKQMIRDVIPNATFKPIPNDYPLYHAFFDFDVPPYGAEIGFNGNIVSEQVFYLEGVWYKDRLAAVYSDKGYIVKWNDNENNEPQLKMGVNLIVFSLIQRGGIVNKTTIDSVR